LDDAEEHKAEFEKALTERLQETGYWVVAPSEFKDRFEKMKKILGPLYDPNTGQVIEERATAAYNYAMREYLAAYRIDALAWARVLPVMAHWYRNSAAWDGIDESSTGKEGFWANFGAPDAYGTMPALSFCLRINSAYGEPCYHRHGGIQLCSHVTAGRFTEVPDHELLEDSKKNTRAVEIACQPLRTKTPAK
jgi:hypothetical protein